MNITIRNIPKDVMSKIRTLSKIERRSLNSQILFVLERGVQTREKQLDIDKNINKEIQTDIWKKLSNRWQDNRSTREIIQDIYESRTQGREFKL
ncbi:MAG: hypothetical protein U5R06_19735 [candidate division KSB1 bacterium]|nr:hypothetical protein [candidate division KSB1 bacterium]